jgi:hypothetical protein
MVYVIFPPESLLEFPLGVPGEWVEVSGQGLGGCFYDYLKSTAGSIVGVRYWLIEAVSFERHPVFSQFLSDPRFLFDESGAYVDIFFNDSSEASEGGVISIDVVQDFGGDSVVRQGEWMGIVFSLADDGDG